MPSKCHPKVTHFSGARCRSSEIIVQSAVRGRVALCPWIVRLRCCAGRSSVSRASKTPRLAREPAVPPMGSLARTSHGDHTITAATPPPPPHRHRRHTATVTALPPHRRTRCARPSSLASLSKTPPAATRLPSGRTRTPQVPVPESYGMAVTRSSRRPIRRTNTPRPPERPRETVSHARCRFLPLQKPLIGRPN